MSPSTIRKVEQGDDVGVETLHVLARALGVSTSDLFVTDSARPVIADGANKQYFVELRKALMPPVGLTPGPAAAMGAASGLAELRSLIADGHALYQADRCRSVATTLPGLLRPWMCSFRYGEHPESGS
jgi:transcriptional regulator with XRE-family HTH domain